MESIQIRDFLASDDDIEDDYIPHTARTLQQEQSRGVGQPIRIINSAPSITNFSNVSALPLPAQIDILQSALRDAQLSATKLHADAREIRRTSSTSVGQPQAIPAPQPGVGAGANQVVDGLKEIAKKLFVLCSPWPMWKISGSFVTELPSDTSQDQPAPGDIIENDEIGDRILSFVPQQLRASFLSLPGQRLIGETISSARSSHIHRLRSVGSNIFGFDSKFFASQYDRSTVQEFQTLLGVKDTPKGKRYPMLPPILYPDGSDMDPKQLFLNPALVKILKVILFGPSSLANNKPVSGPKPAGKKWGLQTVTPEAIALAAILARFLLSPDEDFSPQGAHTRVNYLKAFRKYRNMIIEEGGTPIYRAIVASFNMSLFASTYIPVSNIICGGDGESEDEMKEYRSRLKKSADTLSNNASAGGTFSGDSAADILPISSPPDILIPCFSPVHTPTSTMPSTPHPPTASSSVLNITDATLPTEPEVEDHPITPEPNTRPLPKKKTRSAATNKSATKNSEVAVRSTRGGNKKAQKRATADQDVA